MRKANNKGILNIDFFEHHPETLVVYMRVTGVFNIGNTQHCSDRLVVVKENSTTEERNSAIKKAGFTLWFFYILEDRRGMEMRLRLTIENKRQKSGAELITEERQEQINKHRWTAEHDADHRDGTLAVIAATLAVMGTDARVNDPTTLGRGSGENPWGLEEKLKNNEIHSLKVAGALIAAEIDRINNQ